MSVSRQRIAARERSGSVLVPVVAAMLLLSLCGGALADLFAAQRLQSVLSVESAQAHWVAEAGAWHAAYDGTSIPTPTPFGSGTYTAVRNGDSYSSTGIQGSARRTSTKDHVLVGSGAGGGSTGTTPTDPLDIAASVATATKAGKDKFEIDLVSLSALPVIISSFSLAAAVPTRRVDKLKLEGDEIWEEGDGVALPTGGLPLNEGDTVDRLIPAGEAPVLRVEFRGGPSGTIMYTLVLRYTNGASSTLVFPIRW